MKWRVITFSDLHLGAWIMREDGDYKSISKILTDAAARSDELHCIVNGDLAEYEERIGPVEKLSKQVGGWISALMALRIEEKPVLEKENLHILPGNHDDTTALSDVASSAGAHFGAKGFMRIGNAVWTHGHLGTEERFQQVQQHSPDDIQVGMGVGLWKAPIKALPGVSSSVRFPLKDILLGTLQWLKQQGALTEETTHVAIGHIHTDKEIHDVTTRALLGDVVDNSHYAILKEYEHIKWNVTGCAALGAPNYVWECVIDENGAVVDAESTMHRIAPNPVLGAVQVGGKAVVDAAQAAQGVADTALTNIKRAASTLPKWRPFSK